MRNKILLLTILLIGCLFRFVLLSDIPSGLTSDEANTGYDAYSILMTGKDQWGNFIPLVSFQGFGDFRSPLYTYLVIPFIVLFDLSSLAVRLPSAIAGVLSILAVCLLVRKFINPATGIAAAFLFAIAPWSIGLSRQGIESNVAIVFVLFGIYFFIKSLEVRKYLYVSVLLFVLSVYAYTAYLFFAPIAFGILFFINRKKLLHNKLHITIASVFFLITMLPMIFGTSAGNTRMSQVGLTKNISSIGTIDVLNQRIGSCKEVLPSVVCRIFENKATTFGVVFVKNYLSHFSPEFLYMNGTTTQFSILYSRGLLYLFEIVFLMAGIFYVIVNKKYRIVLLLLLLAPIPDALSSTGHHSRASVMMPFLLIIEAVGFVYLLKFIKNQKNGFSRITTYLVLGLIILISIITFAITYFNHFKNHYSAYSLYVYRDVSKDIYLQRQDYNQLYLSTYLNDTQQYIFYLFYNKYSPEIYQLKKNVEYEISPNGFIKVTKIDNLNFGNYDFSQDLGRFDQSNDLYVGHPDAFTKEQRAIKEYKELTGGTIFKSVRSKDLIRILE